MTAAATTRLWLPLRLLLRNSNRVQKLTLLRDIPARAARSGGRSTCSKRTVIGAALQIEVT